MKFVLPFKIFFLHNIQNMTRMFLLITSHNCYQDVKPIQPRNHQLFPLLIIYYKTGDFSSTSRTKTQNHISQNLTTSLNKLKYSFGSGTTRHGYSRTSPTKPYMIDTIQTSISKYSLPNSTRTIKINFHLSMVVLDRLCSS